MCGRFTQTLDWKRAARFLDFSGSPPDPRPRYNVAPSQGVAVIRGDRDDHRLAMLNWGFIPGWADNPRAGPRPINARAETARTKPLFRSAFASRRCLVPTDGFYEWKREDGGAKWPWSIRMEDGGMFAFAGIWERWTSRGNDSEVIESFAILTTIANSVVEPIHQRMPVILDREEFGPWLAGEDVTLETYPPEGMIARPVSRYVNSPANEGPRCLEPIRND